MFAHVSNSSEVLQQPVSSTLIRTTFPHATTMNIEALPPSDFKDLISLLQQHERDFQDLVATVDDSSTEKTPANSVQNDVKYSNPISPLQASISSITRDAAKELGALQQQCRDIEASYGWVLASDIALAARIFDSKDAREIKAWLKETFDKYEERKEALSRLIKK
jgi:hypothetical protein